MELLSASKQVQTTQLIRHSAGGLHPAIYELGNNPEVHLSSWKSSIRGLNSIMLLLLVIGFSIGSSIGCGAVWGQQPSVDQGLIGRQHQTDQPKTAKPAPAEPKIASKSDEGQIAISSFKLPSGWQCQLVAAEPLMANPVAFTVDNHGRIFVCESYRQNKGVTDNRFHNRTWLQADLACLTVQDRIRYHRELLGSKAADYEREDDLLRLLIDDDGDHLADRSTVFANGFNGIEEGTGAGVIVRGGQVVYANIPRLYSLTDRDQDGVADQRLTLSEGYGVRVAFRGHDLHGLIQGPDGRLYFSMGDRGYHVQTPNGVLANPESGAVFRCDWDGSGLEVIATGMRNPQELAFDDFGRLFTGDNNSDSGDRARWVYVVRGGDSGWRMTYQYLPDRGPFNREKIWQPYSPGETPAYIVPPIANVSDGPSGLACYPGTGLGEEYRGAFFLCDFRGQSSNSGIRVIRLAEQGAFFTLASADETIWNLLATDCEFGPDGGLYVSDWVNGWTGEGKGRIYRFADPRFAESDLVRQTQRLLAEGMASKSLDELEKLLSHADRRVRWEAHGELSRRESIDRLTRVAKNEQLSITARLSGVWGLGQVARRGNQIAAACEALLDLTADREAMIASVALQVLGDAPATKSLDGEALDRALTACLNRPEAVCRAAACQAAGQLVRPDCFEAVVRVAEQNADVDPIVRHSAIMGLAGFADASLLTKLIDHSSESVRLAAVVALRRLENEAIFAFLKDASPQVRKEAVRAVHDVPSLASGLELLAEMLTQADTDDAVVRRAMNANFRLGTAEAAKRLCEAAANRRFSTEHRLLALKMLGTWADPSPLDLVSSRYAPLPKRDDQPVVESLRSNLVQLTTGNPTVRTRYLSLAAKLKISDVAPTLVKIAQDTSRPDSDRASAIEGLAELDESQALVLAKSSLDESNSVLQLAALKTILRLSPDEAKEPLTKATQSGAVAVRQTAWDLIAKIDQPWATSLIEQGIAAYLDRSLPGDCRLNVREAAVDRLSSAWQEKLDAFCRAEEDQAASDPTRLYADCIQGGNIEAGRELFFTRANLSCVRCHKVGSQGGEVGPDLSSLGSKQNAAYMLQAIVNPNATIAKGFETINILDDQGNTYTGILKNEDDQVVQLMTAEGKTVSIDQSAIEVRKKGLSSMPADLTKFLTHRELRDLVAYLSALDGSPEAIRSFSDQVGHGH